MRRFFPLLVRAFFHTAFARMRRGPLRPGWTFMFETVIRAQRTDWMTLWKMPSPFIRAHTESLSRQVAPVKGVTRTPVSAGGVPAEWFVPEGAGARDVLMYFHGGSYIFGSTNTHHDIIARLALASGMRALAINYRLAPEHPFPAALEDALAAYRWVLAEGTDPARVVFAGESAGGNLLVVAMLELRARGEPLPAGGAAISPWVNLESNGESMETNAPYDYGTREMLLFQAKAFAGAEPLGSPRVSPVQAELAGLPPLLVQVGGAELLLEQCTRFAERAKAAGVDVTLDVLPEMPHAAALFNAFHPTGARAIETAANFIRARVARTGA